jgi:hypothetical protein
MGERAASVAAIALALTLGLGGLAPAMAQILTNGQFDTDISGWADPFPDPEVVLSWDPLDAGGDPASGSLRIETAITNGTADGPRQCLATGPGLHRLEASLRVPSGQENQPFPYILQAFYDDVGCGGTELDEDATFWGPTTGVWQRISSELEAPIGTRSLGVRLFSGNTIDGDPTAVAYFDDVVLSPEPGAGTAGAAAVAALLARRRPGRRAPRRHEAGAGNRLSAR